MVIDSPIGPLTVLATDAGLQAICFGAEPDRVSPADPAPYAAQLHEYFAGERETFDAPLAFAAGSEWERRVWAALLDVPYGTTATYGEIAERIGAPGKARAVGWANGRNPIPIVVPCHRVIGAGGKLTGYGGGLDVKEQLLRLEGALLL